MFSYSFSSYSMASSITNKTELGIMKSLKVKWLNWCAWFVVLFLLQLLITFLSLFILSSCGWEQNIYEYSDPVIIFRFMLAYIVANITFTLMVCSIIVQQSWSAISSILIHMLTYLPFPVILVFYYRLSLLPLLVFCLILNTGLAIGLNIILDLERTAEGLHSYNFNFPHFAGSYITLGHVTTMLLLSAVIHVLILIYVEGKRSEGNAASKYVDVRSRPVAWCYPIKSLFKWCRKKQESKVLTHSMLCELLSDVSIGADAPKEPKVEKNTMTQISQKPISVDVDVAVYQKYQSQKKPLKLELSNSASIINLIKPEQIEHRSKDKLQSPSLENLSQSSSSHLKFITSGDTMQSQPLHSQDSPFIESTSSHTSCPSRLLFPIENVELANVDEGISVINISKSIDGVEYLSNISMTIHPKEVTVILGKKEAGTMLLAEIIAGTVKMTSGHVVVNGKNISDYKTGKHFDQPFAIMPKEDITFRDLTIKENLYFYTYVRGMRNHRQIAREIRKYLAKLDIPELVDTPVNMLGFGMNRCLGFCCAMCGGCHDVILDEPTLGLDLHGSHRMWDMIKMAAHDRAIIVCTHRHEEAVILADRIAVLDWGRLQCYGRTQKLLNSFCNDYYLNCRKTHGEDNNPALEMMKRIMPTGLEVQLDDTKQLHIRIPDGNEKALALILRNLENTKGNHNIKSFTLFRKTLRDMFIQSNTKLHSLPNSAVANILRFDPDKRKNLRLQLQAILIKKFIYLRKNILLPLLWLLLFAVSIVFEISPQGTDLVHLPKMDLSLCSYKTTLVLSKSSALLSPKNFTQQVAIWFSQYMQNNPGFCSNDESIFRTIKGRRELIQYIFRDQQMSLLKVETFYVAAMEFNPDGITCFWNGKLNHAAPISLNLIHNALFQYVTNLTKATIKVANYPFKFTYGEFLNLKRLQQNTNLNMGTLPFFIFFAGVSVYTIHLVYEVRSGRMMLELMSGVSYNLYWITKFIWDIVLYNICIVALIAIIIVNDLFKADNNTREYNDSTFIAIMMLLFEIFGLAVLPFIYLLSFQFKNMLFGYLLTFLILTGTSLLPIVAGPGIERVLDANVDVIQYLLYWSPSFLLVHGMRQLHVLGAINQSVRRLCGAKMSFCETYDVPSYFGFQYPGVLVPFIILILLAMAYGLIFYNISQFTFLKPWLRKLHRKCTSKHQGNTFKSSVFDVDISLEGKRICSLDDKERGELALTFVDVVYSKYLKGVSFGIKHREVFGIVGRFGSGKSKILQVTAGIGVIEKGDVYVYGKSVRYNPKEAFKYLGYCPKQNDLYEYMTVNELLDFYCRLSGRKKKERINLVEWLMTSLDLMDKLKVLVGNLVFADCRKLSLAVAVISSNQVIMMDEPTRGVDPRGCQLIWQMIGVLHKMGRTVVLAMESLEECLPLCDRICILVNGRLQCIGSVDYLIQKFSRGSILQIYTRKAYESQVELENSRLLVEMDSNARMGDSRNSQRSRTLSVQLTSESSEDYEDFSSARIHKYQTPSFHIGESRPSNEEDVFCFWNSQLQHYRDISEFIEVELPYARLEEQYSNMLVYYIPFSMFPLSQVFSMMEACTILLNVSHYMVWRPSIIDMYEHFTKQHCRFWGNSASLTKQSSRMSLSWLVSIKRSSKWDRIKRIFRREMY
ncbi:ATP-binding cassette sub-family A member 17-like [Drosophila willistoni]|uniref:ATP-binding cassette sub-family A member 17-like n=1 Tax=Drosophila willistoni TaxID=7260 RepID=UPI001F07553B|nr:ATP-binding cassette sub-family A member 17-like [Drosophila willistoni]